MYAYEPRPLDARVEAVDTFDYWTREEISFAAPYGEGRGGALLYRPHGVDEPIQTVIHWPGSSFADLTSADQVRTKDFDFLVRSGRAVALPIFNGALWRDRGGTVNSAMTVGGGNESLLYRDIMIEWVKDVSRTIDYIATQNDLNARRIGLYGFSWGGFAGPVALAVEPRIKAGVLDVGGFWDARFIPEVDALNFAPRVRQPVLMINGEHDILFPRVTSSVPLFDLLGTDEADKDHYIAVAGHYVPRNEVIRETLDSLDRYLRPVD